MFKKIKDTLFERTLDLAAFFKEINFKALPAQPKELIKKTLQAIDADAKAELTLWLESVQDVKKNADLSKKEKNEQLAKLKPSDAVITFFNSLIDLLIEKIPINNKSILKTGAAGIGFAASFMNFRKAGVALLILHSALPKFILTKQFDDLSDFLIEQLKHSDHK